MSQLCFTDTPTARKRLRRIREIHRQWGGTSRLVAKRGRLELTLDGPAGLSVMTQTLAEGLDAAGGLT